MSQAMINGSRLEYVVVLIEGTVRRNVHKFDKKGGGIKTFNVEQPGGYLVYFPRGHVIRLSTKEELKHYNLHKLPKIVNLQGLNDPNSPIGRLMSAQDDDARRGAMDSLERQVMTLAQAKSGKVEVCRDVADLEAQMEDA